MSTTELATYLQKLLDRRSWSMRTLAMYAEISHSTVSRALKGTHVPDPESIRKIAAALEIEETHLLRLAGHIEAPQWETDSNIVKLAQRLASYSPQFRTAAIGSVNQTLDLLESVAGGVQVATGQEPPRAWSSEKAEPVTQELEETAREGFEIMNSVLDRLEVLDPKLYQRLVHTELPNLGAMRTASEPRDPEPDQGDSER